MQLYYQNLIKFKPPLSPPNPIPFTPTCYFSLVSRTPIGKGWSTKLAFASMYQWMAECFAGKIFQTRIYEFSALRKLFHNRKKYYFANVTRIQPTKPNFHHWRIGISESLCKILFRAPKTLKYCKLSIQVCLSST